MASNYVFSCEIRTDGKWRREQSFVTVPTDADLDAVRRRIFANLIAERHLPRRKARRPWLVTVEAAADPEFIGPPSLPEKILILFFLLVAIGCLIDALS